MAEQTYQSTEVKGQVPEIPKTGESLIRPYLREAIRVTVTPQPNDDSAPQIAEKLRGRWGEWGDSYAKMIAGAANVPLSKLSFKSGDQAQTSTKGYTSQADYPRLHYIEDGCIFEMGVTAAICTKCTSKLWSRAGITSKNGEPYGVNINNLPTVIRKFNDINRQSTEWLFGKVQEAFKSFPDNQMEKSGTLQISTYGTNDENFKDFFDTITSQKKPILGILDNLKLVDKFSLYWNTILNTKNIMDDYIRSEAKNARWFTDPVYVKTRSGEEELREVLYLVRSSEGNDQVFGLRYDDSIDGVLPQESALDVARWLGVRI